MPESATQAVLAQQAAETPPAGTQDAAALPWLHGGDLAAQQLKTEGIRHLFTLTGGHISTVYDGCRFAGISLVDFRHEQAVVHAADGYARATRAPAAAAVTAGPGVTGALTGVANAFYANSPVVVLGGRNPFATDAAGNLQEAPHLELMRPVTKFAQAVYDVWRTREVIHDAFASASAPRFGPAFVDLPMDVQLTRFMPDQAPPARVASRATAAEPDADAVRTVAERFARASRPVIFAGSGAYWAGAERTLDAFVRSAQAPVFLNGMARGLLGRRHPFQFHTARKPALQQADLVLMLGVDFDFRFDFGQPGALAEDAVVIQVDGQADRLGRNRNVALAIHADISRFLAALIRHDGIYGALRARPWTDALRGADAAAEAERQQALASGDAPIHPLRLVHEVAAFLDEDAVLIGDGGDIVSLMAKAFMPGRPGHWMDPGPFGCLGVGAPFAIGARLAWPDKQIAVMFGDGSFGFNGFEFDSAVRQKLPFVGIIGNDGAWGEMRTFHEDIFGPEHLQAQYLSQGTAYERVVEALGGHGERVETASQIRPALQRAFNAGVPALVNVIIDPTYRRRAGTISGAHVARSLGGGDGNAYRRP